MGLLVFVTVHKDSGYLLEVTGLGDQVRVLHHQQNMYRELRGKRSNLRMRMCASFVRILRQSKCVPLEVRNSSSREHVGTAMDMA
jgi:hypothetical protein